MRSVGAITDQAARQAAQQSRRQDLCRMWAQQCALICSACLIMIQLTLWIAGINVRGGPDSYARGSTDFLAILTGALIIRDGNGRNLYDVETQRAAQRRVLGADLAVENDSILVYVHPPPEALLIAPLLELPYPLSYTLWNVGSILAFVLALWLLQRTLPLPRSARWAVLIAFCAAIPLHRTLWMAQTSTFVFLGLCGTYAALRHRDETRAGLWLPLVALKPQLLPLVILLLILLSHWRTIFTAGVIGVVACALMSPVLGLSWPLRYIALIAEESRWGAERGEHPERMHVWRGLITNLLGDTMPQLVTPLFVALALASIVLILWSWWRVRRLPPPSMVPQLHLSAHGRGVQPWDLLWAVTGIAAILLPNHLYLHDLLPLLLPAWIMVVVSSTAAWSDRKRLLWVCLLWANHGCLALTLFTSRFPAVAVVPSVLLLAFTALLLTAQIVKMTDEGAATYRARLHTVPSSEM
jgi:hypothetical protein